MNPIDSVKALWRDPKKRPFLIGGAGLATFAGLRAARRPSIDDVSESEAPLNDVPITGSYPDAGADIDYAGGTGVPPVYVYGSGPGGADPAFSEVDLSGVYQDLEAGLSQQWTDMATELQASEEAAKQRDRAIAQRGRQTDKELQKARQKIKRQHKQTRQLRRRVDRLTRRPSQSRKKPAPRKKPVRRRR